MLSQPIPQQPPQSAKPAPVQEVPEKSELAKPVSVQPEKQPEKPVHDKDLQSGTVVEDGETVTLHDVNIYDKYFAVYVKGKNSVA
ncbi:hypothetical protein, partial [Bartonella grahamii]|uniref:hypothetical protein n=1 Tax=Bartonella grahamii TaxID=33045 RepID=UPI001ABB3FA1